MSVSQAAVSKHLRVLRDAGLVHALNVERLGPAASTIGPP